MDEHEKLSLAVDPRVDKVLEERGIKPEDIQGVIAYAVGTGNAFKNTSIGRFLASRRKDRTTYWVEYSPDGGRYVVFTAYSHRMEILEGFNMPAKPGGGNIDWLCAKCGVALELATVKLTYLDETFAADIPACPSCQRALVSEENAVEKMALAERMLEDK